MTIAIVLDTETSGLTLPSTADDSKQPRIIEFGAVRLKVEAGVATRVDETNFLINPGFPVSDEITKITGITNDALKDKPGFKVYVPALAEFFTGADVVIAHNAPFDVQMLKMDLARAGAFNTFPLPKNQVCTVQEFSHVFGRRPKMTELYEHYLKRPLAQTHRALDDCKALVEILDASKFWETM